MKTGNATGDAPRLHQTVLAHIQSGLRSDVRSAQVSTTPLLLVLAEVKLLLDFVGIRQARLLADRGFCDTDLLAWLQFCGFLARTDAHAKDVKVSSRESHLLSLLARLSERREEGREKLSAWP